VATGIALLFEMSVSQFDDSQVNCLVHQFDGMKVEFNSRPVP
jgi:hypothetical protein